MSKTPPADDERISEPSRPLEGADADALRELLEREGLLNDDNEEGA